MIKNVVFDMGKVLVDYDSMIVCRHFIDDDAERDAVHTAVFVSPEWVMLDMGVIEEGYALAKMQERLKSSHAKEMARLCFVHWHEYCMQTIQEMGDVIRGLKEAGYGIYLCSNASIRLPACYRQVIPAVDCFDGILFSAEERCMKPQREIYLRLFEKFSLTPGECFFIDDLAINVDGARACGMDGYCHDGDVGKLREVLEERCPNKG